MTGPEAGTAFDYTHWRPGEPSGYFGATEYVHIEGVDDPANGGWNDAPDAAGGRDFVEEWGDQTGQEAFREDTGTTLTTAQLLAHATDADSTLTVTSVSATSAHGGTVSLDGNIVTYHPAADYNGADSFTYTVSDGSLSSTGTVSFNVAGPPATVLTTSNDHYVGTASPAVVTGTAATLNAGDSLVGGGNDTLVLYNGGEFYASSLSALSGFSKIVLDDPSSTNARSDLYLGSFIPAMVSGVGGGQIFVYNDTAAHWNGTASFSDLSYLELDYSFQAGAAFDLTHNVFTNIGAMNIFGSGSIVTINNADAASVSLFSGAGGNDKLTTSDAVLDLSHASLNGTLSVVSSNAGGTTFIVGTDTEASYIYGGAGQDTIQASGFLFTAAQKDDIFSTTSIETLIDFNGTYHASTPDPSVRWLTTGNDTVGSSPDGITVSALSTTLTSGDHLTGGGHDTLKLYNSGTFNVSSLAAFSGFSNIVLENFSNVGAYLYLGSVIPSSISSAGDGATYVYSDTAFDWNSSASFSGLNQINLNYNGTGSGTFNLTGNTFSNIGTLTIGGSVVTVSINSADVSGISNISGNYVTDKLTTSDATLDLSHTTLNSLLAVVSTNAVGTTFVVHDVASALDIFGGTGQDTIQASGFDFTLAQRDLIFATASIETIVDGSGTYHMPSDPSIVILTPGADSVSSTTDGLTVNATAATLNYTDSLVGAGHDQLVLHNGGNFSPGSAFSGFSSVVLDNNSSAGAALFLSSFTPAWVTGIATGTGLNTVYNDTTAHWNGTASFSDLAQINLNYNRVGSTIDLTHNTFSNIGNVTFYGFGETLIINSADAAGISSFTNGTLTTADAILDLSHSTLSGSLSVVSTNTGGTTFVVGSASDASYIVGGTGDDTIQASGFSFTLSQVNSIFAGTSIETITDASGIYHSASYQHTSVAAGGSLEISQAIAYSDSVTFQGSTGSLILDTPSTFQGKIVGFSGGGLLNNSDQIDLKNIAYSTLQHSYSSGTLYVSDGTHSGALRFAGNYVAANFKFADDGSGGTIVYDPPVSTTRRRTRTRQLRARPFRVR